MRPFLLAFLLSLPASAQMMKPPPPPPPPQPRPPPPKIAAPGREQAMLGGKFSGSNLSGTSGFQLLAEIKSAPPAAKWTDLSFPNTKIYRWLRYEAPAGSHGNVAELEFYSGARKFYGTYYGSYGWRDNRNWPRAFDRNTATFFDSDCPDGQYLGIDVGEQGAPAAPRMSPETASQQSPLQVTLTCATPGAVIHYAFDAAPGPDGGQTYTKPIAIDRPTVLFAFATKDGMAPGPINYGTYSVARPIRPGLHSVHVGNSLTASTHFMPDYAALAGYRHDYQSFLKEGGNTPLIWQNMQTPAGKEDWDKTLAAIPHLDIFTVQPRMRAFDDASLAEEAKYDSLFFDAIRARYPDVQPWIYAEWPARQYGALNWNATYDSQSKVTGAAPDFEEACATFLHSIEAVEKIELQTYKGPKPPRILPCTLAVARLKNLLDTGAIPGLSAHDMDPSMFADNVHPGPVGRYLIDMIWFAAFYRESPVGKIPPIYTTLNATQAAILQRLAWDIVTNYPDCRLYHEGATPVAPPKISPGNQPGKLTLTSTTPGAWFRYTIDGTAPTRTNGYIYCGVITLKPTDTLKVISYKTGLADSPIVTYQR